MQTSTESGLAAYVGSKTANEATSDIDLIDIKELCRLIGGSRPVHPSTVYRLIQAGKLPKPNKKLRRWVKAPVVDAIKALIDEAA
jgi:predicted DNA-binding transcriptional regulator AlpA